MGHGFISVILLLAPIFPLFSIAVSTVSCPAVCVCSPLDGTSVDRQHPPKFLMERRAESA